MKQKDIFVVVRTCGERTFPLVLKILEKQVPKENIIVLSISPWFKSICEMFRIAKDRPEKYLLAIDADTIPRGNIVKKILKNAEKRDEKTTFRIFYSVVDKFFDLANSGNHLYFNKWSKKFYEYLKEHGDPTINKPESGNNKRFRKINKLEEYGEKSIQIGYHAFYQYYYHIFNTLHNKRIRDLKNKKKLECLKKKVRQFPKDDDYKIALEGYRHGLKYDKINLNSETYFKVDDLLEKYGIKEKKALLYNAKIRVKLTIMEMCLPQDNLSRQRHRLRQLIPRQFYKLSAKLKKRSKLYTKFIDLIKGNVNSKK